MTSVTPPIARAVCTALLVAAPLAAPATAGATLVYSTSDGIFVANDDGSAPRALSDDGENPSITDDGRYVAWTEDGRVRIAAVDGATPRRTLPRDYRLLEDHPGWTGRDELLVDRGNFLARAPFVAVDPATGARRRIATGDVVFSATASPDGTQLVAERAHRLAARGPARRAIVVFGAAGATTVAHGTRPVWGPSGIAYVKPRGRYGDLQVVTPAGRVVYRLRRSKAVVWPVEWLDDGRLLAATAREYPFRDAPGTRALLVDTVAGNVTELPGSYFGVFGIKPDGSALLALDDHYVPLAVSLADGHRTVLFDGTVDDIGWSRR
jgi:hypothetical protein